MDHSRSYCGSKCHDFHAKCANGTSMPINSKPQLGPRPSISHTQSQQNPLWKRTPLGCQHGGSVGSHRDPDAFRDGPVEQLRVLADSQECNGHIRMLDRLRIRQQKLRPRIPAVNGQGNVADRFLVEIAQAYVRMDWRQPSRSWDRLCSCNGFVDKLE